jgi:Luciferase-like monooxygenase
MNFGLFSINAYAAAEPRTLARVAQAAESAGFDSLWAGEHVVLPDPQAPPSPMAPTDAILDPAIALTYAAAVTTRVRLGTGIIILPEQEPMDADASARHDRPGRANASQRPPQARCWAGHEDLGGGERESNPLHFSWEHDSQHRPHLSLGMELDPPGLRRNAAPHQTHAVKALALFDG